MDKSDAISLMMKLKGLKTPSYEVNEGITKALVVHEPRPWTHDEQAAFEFAEIVHGTCEIHQDPILIGSDTFLATTIVINGQEHQCKKVTKSSAHGICIAVLEALCRDIGK